MIKSRSPAYPFISLDKALERAREFYVSQRHHPAPLGAAVALWGYKPKSSGGQQTVGALKQFGLMKDEGSGEQRHVCLTDLALRIIRDQREHSSERDAAIREAALMPKVHSIIRDKWGLDLPATSTVLFYLVHERNFTENAATDLISEYEKTISFAKLGGESMSAFPNDEDSLEESEKDTEGAPLSRNSLRNTHEEIDGSERIVFTEENDPQNYIKLLACGEVDEWLLDALEDYIKRQKRRIKRDQL